jgi:hypothetical protein
MTRGTFKGEENDIGFMWDLHIEARCFADFKKWQQSKACRVNAIRPCRACDL